MATKAAYKELQMESFGYDSMPNDQNNNGNLESKKLAIELVNLKNDGKVPGYETEDLT